MRALVTGASGQDGRYLSALLAAKGFEVVAWDRAKSLDPAEWVRAMSPDRIYHLAAHHRASEPGAEGDDDPRFFEVSLTMGHALLRGVRRHAPKCRVFLAGSAHVFGDATESPQSEATPFAPVHPYGIAKAALIELGRWFRTTHGLFVAGGILYNHESPHRRPEFLTQRIATAAAEIAAGKRESLAIGDLDAQVDWGFAGDYVEAMWKILEAGTPDDYVVATGALHTPREFAQLAFAHAGLDWSRYVRQDAKVFERVGRAIYAGDPSKIQAQLGWRATTSIDRIAAMMVDAAAQRLAGEKMS